MAWSAKASNFIQKRLVEPLLAFLKQGVSPAKLALALTVGILIATFPVFGSHTLLCALAIYLMRLNGPVVFLSNNLTYPLIFITYIPLLQLGAYLFGSSVNGISLEYVFSLFDKGFYLAIVSLWDVTIHAIFAWCLIALPLGLVSYYILLFLLKKVAKTRIGK